MRPYDKVQTAVFGALAVGGELWQNVALADPSKYTWLMGHLSNLAHPACLTALLYSRARDDTDSGTFRNVSVALAPALLTIGEIADKLTVTKINGGTYDPQDIACYWVGALSAVGLSELAKSGKVQKLTKRLFRRETLDEQLTQEV